MSVSCKISGAHLFAKSTGCTAQVADTCSATSAARAATAAARLGPTITRISGHVLESSARSSRDLDRDLLMLLSATGPSWFLFTSTPVNHEHEPKKTCVALSCSLVGRYAGELTVHAWLLCSGTPSQSAHHRWDPFPACIGRSPASAASCGLNRSGARGPIEARCGTGLAAVVTSGLCGGLRAGAWTGLEEMITALYFASFAGRASACVVW